MVFLAGAVWILKLTLGCTVTALAVTVSMDKDVHRLVKKVRKMIGNVKMVKSFTVENEHATIIGLTQHGKTYGTIKTLERMTKPVLLFNSQHTSVMGNDWVEADGSNTTEQIIYALQQGYKVNFLPADENIDGMSKQLASITNAIYSLGRFDFYFAIDEVHLFWMGKEKAGKEALIRLATTGLGRGFKCLFLSQRPAKVDNTLYTQSTKHIIFALGKLDESYLKTNGFPVDEILTKTENEKYVFVEFNQKEIKGPFKIG